MFFFWDEFQKWRNRRKNNSNYKKAISWKPYEQALARKDLECEVFGAARKNDTFVFMIVLVFQGWSILQFVLGKRTNGSCLSRWRGDDACDVMWFLTGFLCKSERKTSLFTMRSARRLNAAFAGLFTFAPRKKKQIAGFGKTGHWKTICDILFRGLRSASEILRLRPCEWRGCDKAEADLIWSAEVTFFEPRLPFWAKAIARRRG